MSLNLEAGLSVILEVTAICYKTSQIFPYTMTTCSRKKIYLWCFYTSTTTTIYWPTDWAARPKREDRETLQTKPPITRSGWYSAALPGTWQSAQGFSSSYQHPSGSGEQSVPISAHSPKTKGKSITAFLKRKSILPGVPRHRAGKWLQTQTDIDNSSMEGRNYTIFRVKEPEPATSSAQLGASLLSDSTSRIKGCIRAGVCKSPELPAYGAALTGSGAEPSQMYTGKETAHGH